MSPPEWEALCFEVRDLMAPHVFQYLTPISQSDDLLRGWSLGTGSYVSLGGMPYLLTNEHVVGEAAGTHLAHLPGPTDDFVLCNNPFTLWPTPVDAAITKLDEPLTRDDRGIIVPEQLDDRYAPVEHELLFWVGFPGSTATRHEAVTPQNTRYSWFGELKAPAIPMLSQQVPGWPVNLPAAYREHEHVLVHYPSEAPDRAGGAGVDLPNPAGMSGSLLWDTKRVACMRAGEDWSVEKARVCGLVWATWPEPEVVVATKVEHLHAAWAGLVRN